MVPNGWIRAKLKDYVDIKHGFAFKSEFFKGNGKYVLLTPGSFFEAGGFRDQGNKTKYYEGDIPQDYILSKGDLLLAMTEQTAGLLGSTLIVPADNKFLHNQRLGLVKIKDDSEVCSEFLFLLYNSPLIRKQISEQSTGTKVKHTSPDKLSSIICLLPPFPEQRKTALTLSVWDKAINTTERLIENSKQQKKSLMQQLLTGKKRFAGFDSEWKELKLSDIGKCIAGLTYSPTDTVKKEGMLVLRSSNVQGGKLAFNDNVLVSAELKVKSKTQEGDILICVRNGSKHLIGKSALIKGRAVNQAHGAFMTLYRSKHPDYVFQLFQTDAYYHQVNKNLGATINSINTSDLHKFKFLIPQDEKEILLISECLTNADKEIDILEQQLSDLKQEKKALMQELLTGKRRVKVEPTDVEAS